MSQATVEGSRGLAGAVRSPFYWALGIAAGLGAIVYGPLFVPPSGQPLAVQGESFFFQANEAAGAPVLALSLWLFYRRSHYLDLLRGASHLGGACTALFLALGSFAWGVHTSAPDIRLASVVPLLIGVFLLLGGRAALRAFWLPIAFLLFALPLSPVLVGAAIFPIQLMTAQTAGSILSVLGFEVAVQGDQILRPENTFIVIETCSGVRTMVTLLMLTVLMIDLFERRGWHAIVLIAIAPIVAFGVNAIRVVTLVLNPHSSVHSIHNLQGLFMLLVGLTAIYLVDLGLETFFGRAGDGIREEDYGVREVATASLAERSVKLVAIAIVLVAMLLSNRMVEPWHVVAGLDEKPQALLERLFGPDPGPPFPMDYNFAGSTRYLAQGRHRVEVDGAIVEVFLGVANEQMRPVSIVSRRLAWPASGYDILEDGVLDDAAVGSSGPASRVRRAVLQRKSVSMLSLSWIERSGGLTAEWFRQAAALDRSDFVRPHHMLAVRLSTRIGPEGVGVAEERIQRVRNTLTPALLEFAPTRPASRQGP